MEEEARKRRLRLQALKENNSFGKGVAASIHAAPTSASKRARDDTHDDESITPESTLQTSTEEEAKDSVEAQANKISSSIRQKLHQVQSADVDILSLAPKKIDWDLKRDVEKKLARLDRRTKRATVELIRLRLTSNLTPLVDAVNAHETLDVNSDDNE